MSYIKYNHGAAPSTPASGKSETFVDSADRRIKQLDDLGVTNILTPWGFKENNLVNGGFEIAQRQVLSTLTTYSNTSGRALSADRWGITNENASVQYQAVDTNTSPEMGLQARFYAKFKKITSAGKMIVSQVIEGSNIAVLRGRTVRLSCKMKYSVAGSMTVRLGLLYLTSAGTVDTIPATFASAFGAVSTDPTWGANLTALAPVLVDGGTLVGLGMTCVLTNAWVRYSATFSVPSNCKNLIAVVWTDGQPAANDELNISEAGLYDGREILDWTPRPVVEELARCQRYYCKTFPLLIAPAQSGGVTGALRGVAGKAAATAQFLQWRYPVTMRATPTTVTLYNPSAANAQVRDVTGAVDCSASASASATDCGLDINATGNAATAVGNELKVHLTADAEL